MQLHTISGALTPRSGRDMSWRTRRKLGFFVKTRVVFGEWTEHIDHPCKDTQDPCHALNARYAS
jgi:hypothetical protein